MSGISLRAEIKVGKRILIDYLFGLSQNMTARPSREYERGSGCIDDEW